MGQERVALVLQVISNYETDLFTPLIKRAADGQGEERRFAPPDSRGRPSPYGGSADSVKSEHKSAASLRGIVDHSRAATFLISDGVLPSNEGRGYVLRKIIRRAITHNECWGRPSLF